MIVFSPISLIIHMIHMIPSSQSRQGSKQEVFTKLSQISTPKGITHQKMFKFMKAIMPKQK